MNNLAADLIRLGLVVVPTLDAKHPGVSATAEGLTVEQVENRYASGLPNRYNVIIGRTDIGLRSGIVDVETDGPVGERALADLAGEDVWPGGPHMRTPSGSIHRFYRVTVPAGMELNFGAGLLPKVDVPWQLLAVDDDLRVWRRLEDPFPECPAALLKLLLRPIPVRAEVAAGEWDGDTAGTPAALKFLAKKCDQLRAAPEGEWNNALYSAARWAAELVAGGTLDSHYAEAAVFDAMDDPDDPKAASTFASAWRAGVGNPRKLTEDTTQVVIIDENGGTVPQGTDGGTAGRPRTDAGNALRLVDRFGGGLRYLDAWKSWLYYDGRRWVRAGNGAAAEAAKATALGILDEAASEVDSDARTALAKWAIQSENISRLKAMGDLARSDPRVEILPERLDRSPWLLNCENGTLDLKTGELGKHNRDDLITRLVPAPFVPDAKAPRWDAFLERVLPTPEVRAYVQRVCGMALTGANPERVMFVFHGDGRNGKTVIAEVMQELLGDYAGPISKDAMIERRAGQVRNDLADARGKRLVVTSETEEGEKLSVAEVKAITGGDSISVRRLYENQFSFRPEFKVWLLTNYLPRVTDPGVATWDRLRVIPFTVRIGDAEVIPLEDMLASFRAEAAGVLAWAVRGCAEWQRIGLAEPMDVVVAGAAWQESEDVIGQFMNEATCEDPLGFLTSSELYKAYCVWCVENGHRPMSLKRLSPMFQKRGLSRCRENGDGRRKGYCGRAFTADGARLASSMGGH